MTDVFLLWCQADHQREIAEWKGDEAGYRPKLMGVFAKADTPTLLAMEYNETHQYSTQWVSVVPVEES